MALNSAPGFQPGLAQSGANNFYTSGIAASQLNGTGSQVQAHKLNRSKNSSGVVVVPGPVQYVEQPVEVVKKVKKQVFVPSPTAAPVVQVNQIDPILRNLLAETHAKIALLCMENNRIKFRIAERDREIARLRSQGGQVITTSSAPIMRPSSTIGSTTVVNRVQGLSTVQPVQTYTTQQAPTTVIQRHVEQTSVSRGPTPMQGQQGTTTMMSGSAPLQTFGTSGTTVTQGGQVR